MYICENMIIDLTLTIIHFLCTSTVRFGFRKPGLFKEIILGERHTNIGAINK